MNQAERLARRWLRKQAAREEITKRYTITAHPETLQKFEQFMAFLHYNGGHTGTFGMSFDGDGHEHFQVSPAPPEEYSHGVGEASQVGGDFETAITDDSGEVCVIVDFQDRSHWYKIEPGEKARKVTYEEVYGD